MTAAYRTTSVATSAARQGPATNVEQFYKDPWSPSAKQDTLSFLPSTIVFAHGFSTQATMSFYPGSVYLLVDAQNQWRLFVAGNPNDTSNAYLTPVGTLYYPGSDLKSKQKLGMQPMLLQPPPVLALHLVNLLSSFQFRSVSSVDNIIDRIVSSGDHGLPPKNESYWWFDILYKLHNGGILNVDAATLAQRIRAEAANAFANYQRTGRCSFVNL